MRRDEADAVVIGSGAGGAPVALSLAEAGLRVVVLEKGPYYTIRDFTRDEVAICRRDFWVPFDTDDPHSIRKRGEANAARTREGWVAQCVGGGTVHMSGFFYRAQPCDFELLTRTGGVAGAELADWPIGYADLEPYFDLMEARVGVSGKSGLNPFEVRRREYPLPPLRPHPAAALIDKAAFGLGLHPFPTARAILSRAYGGRAHCTHCGYCGDYGCETTARSTMLSTLIPAAEATGRCEIRPRSMAQRINCDEEGRVRSVEFCDPKGEVREVFARVVVVACGAVESARLLLSSQSGRHPRGLGNGSGLVGRHLTFSTFGKATAIFARRALEEQLGKAGMDLPHLQRSLQDDYWNEKLSTGFPKGGTLNFLFHHPNPINAAVRIAQDAKFALWGAPLRERLRRYFHEEIWIEAEVFSEFLANPGTYVDLDPKLRDRFDLPVARISVDHVKVADDNNKLLTRRAMDVFEAVRPKAELVTPWTWSGTTYHLQHGTCRFGRDPSSSVLDPSCQSHEVPNLYVTDGSFMPTSLGIPATPTILANAFRVGRLLIERFHRREV